VNNTIVLKGLGEALGTGPLKDLAKVTPESSSSTAAKGAEIFDCIFSVRENS
jgi:hypothetical protein